MADDPHSPQADKPAPRAERLAAALKANLRRRKAAAAPARSPPCEPEEPSP